MIFKMVAHSLHRRVYLCRGFRFFWPCGPCLAFCDLWLTTGLASPSPPAYFKRTLKWPRIVSIAVCALVKALSSFGCGSLVLGLFASNLPLPTFDSVHHPRPSVKSVVKVVLSTCDSQLSIILMSVFMFSLKWSHIVSAAVC